MNWSSTGIQIEYRGDKSSDSYRMMTGGNLKLEDNLFFNVMGDATAVVTRSGGAQDSATGTFQYYIEKDATGLPNDAGTTVKNTLEATNYYETTNMGITAVSLIPTSASANGTEAEPAGDTFFTDVSYHGAFEPNATTNWADGWTLYVGGYGTK
jgi:hypothetical protein